MLQMSQTDFYLLPDDPDVVISGCALTPDVVLPEQSKPVSVAVFNQVLGSPFSLEQNYPNPFVDETTVPFVLTTTADVRLNLFDRQGRKLASVIRKARRPGPQSITLNLHGLGLPPGDYTYQVQVMTKHGVFQQAKLMTAA
ncbi:T9SS type A sorting domain-containing protein [Hymenobacter terrenus]|uniref:T9SS type A sorting domain-containing protein n=1 Tax=Hymenobacter terrenus TaxID=1629124 RepID=UPI0006195B9D|nr:T9SS type A sorting domain-containing protein [Hymenobacter terrenus]